MEMCKILWWSSQLYFLGKEVTGCCRMTVKMMRGLEGQEGSTVSPASCRWEKRQLQGKAGMPFLCLPGLAQAACLPSKADVLSHLAIIPIIGYMWGCFIYRELKLDLEKQFWIYLGVKSLQAAKPELVNGEQKTWGKVSQ